MITHIRASISRTLKARDHYYFTKFGIPTSKNIRDMHRTRSGTDGQTDGHCDYYKN